jgi:hypothetical protein
MLESSVCFIILGVLQVVSYSISCAISLVIRLSIRCVYWLWVVIQGYFCCLLCIMYCIYVFLGCDGFGVCVRTMDKIEIFFLGK